MSVTNMHDLFLYTSNVTSNNLEKIKPLYDLKQPKITGSASSLVSEAASLSTNLCMFIDANSKLTVGSQSLNVSSDKLALLDGLDKPIIESIENVSNYLEKKQTESQVLIDDLLINVSNSISNITREAILLFEQDLYSVDDLFNMNLDSLTSNQEGTNNKFIKNNIHDDFLNIKGSLITSNLLVNGDTFTIDGNAYRTNKVEIISPSDSTEPCLDINASEPNDNILELKSSLNRNAVTMSSTGKVSINKAIPQHSLDVNGIINIDYGFNYKIKNNDLSFQDLDNIPSVFTPSAHNHQISEIGGLRDALNNKQNIIDGFSWDASQNVLNINKNLNLVYGHKFKINNNVLSSVSSSLLWTASYTGIVTRDLINITPYNINIDNTNYPNSKGIFLNEGSITTYSGNILSTNNVESKDTLIKNNIIIGRDNVKWRIYTSGTLQNDLRFESTIDNGTNWTLRAKMNGFADYSDSVYTNFTGVHHCKAITNDVYDNKYIGYIVSASEHQFSGINSIYDPSNIAKHFDKKSWDFLPVVSLSKRPYDKSVFGVIAKIEGNDEHERNEISGNFVFPIEKKEYDRRLHIAGSGEGGIWVCDYNGVLESGDFITTSPIHGIGMKQDNDIVCNYTVGKITMDCDFEPNTIFTSNFDDITETKEYELKYLDSNGLIIDNVTYVDMQSSNIPVYKMAFVGCSYNC